MGINIELVIACELKPNLSQEVVATIKFWIGTVDYDGDVGYDPDLDQRSESRDLVPPWYFGRLGGMAVEFPASGRVLFEPCTYDPSTDEIYILGIRCGTKNTYRELQAFLRWIAPYSQTEGFVGYLRNELQDNPKLIYFREGKAFLTEIQTQTETEIEV